MPRLLPLLVLAAALPACARAQGPDVLLVEYGEYAMAFELAIDLLRDEGLRPTLRDPRTGVIEAGPAPVGSMLEPWRTQHASFDAALESTIHHQRRRVRLDFIVGNADAAQPLDLTETEGPFVLRVQAWLERAYEPGQRRNLWSRQLSDETIIYPPGETEQTVESRFWLPVRRDAEYETHLMTRLQEMLHIQRTPSQRYGMGQPGRKRGPKLAGGPANPT